MRILIVAPALWYKSYPFFISNTDFPVGVAYLASALGNAGHEVFGLNPNNKPGFDSPYGMIRDLLVRSLEKNKPDLIGLSGLCVDYRFLKDTIQILRSVAPDIPIVCGGGVINHDAEFIIRRLKPDFCIIGEGEEIYVQLVNRLESGKEDFEKINNLGYWRHGKPRFTQKSFDYIDIDKRSFPDYEPFEIDDMLDNYAMAARNLYRYIRDKPRQMTIVTARGCPFNCTFCVHQRGPRYRARSTENIMQEIEVLYDRYHFNILIIIDELFALKKDIFQRFCSELIGRKKEFGWDFNWLFQTHASINLDLNDIKMAKEAGCYSFTYGIESASPKILASMNKKIKPSQIERATKFADEANINFGGNFLFGDIVETEETISESIEFMSRHCRNNYIGLRHVQPYPGSKIFDYCVEEGIIRDKVEYYEHIDEGLVYNMTSFPDSIWVAWIEKVISLSHLLTWSSLTDSLSCEVDPSESSNPMVKYYGKPIVKISVKCPLCQNIYAFREPMWKAQALKSAAYTTRIKRFYSRVVRSYQQERRGSGFFTYFVSYSFREFLSRIKEKKRKMKSKPALEHSIFQLLHPIEEKGRTGGKLIITICIHCGRIFRVNIPEMEVGRHQ